MMQNGAKLDGVVDKTLAYKESSTVVTVLSVIGPNKLAALITTQWLPGIMATRVPYDIRCRVGLPSLFLSWAVCRCC